MAISRRSFLKGSSLAAASSLVAPALLGNPFVRKAFADTIGDRYFLSVFLDGGNDGFNTVLPVDDGGATLRTAYDAARTTGSSGINIGPAALAGTLIGTDPGSGAQLALHPALTGFKQLYDAGKLAVIQGCGYPRPNLSHESSRLAWETGTPPGQSAGTGWLGRYLAANYTGNDIPAICLRWGLGGEFRQTATSVLATGRLRYLNFPYDPAFWDDIERKRQAFHALYTGAQSTGLPIADYIGASGIATLLATESYAGLHDLYESDRPEFNQAYEDLDERLGYNLREAAKVIHGIASGVPNVHARLLDVATGGYDTHSDQGSTTPDGHHWGLLAEVGNSLKLFYDDCVDMGVGDKVVIMVWSEFGRRVPQNDGGTDHGTQYPVFVLGGAVQGGVYGNHPNINESALSDDGNTVYSQAAADPFRSTDMRDVYGTILKHWLGMAHGTILGSVLALDAGDPAERWTQENFDMGFLA
ncbi:MAG: hypothetical protein B6D46_03810 [Polyangiaceae bacterium UTPRO1]|nr:DUF1501 domain-containing protein [Myxococcales bacterium]OQY68322.1 MAG: hypothetical protein B6D46_03810 [Polyangiaceae bacterium UTPRO1]